MNKIEKLSVVIPLYNEEENIASVLQEAVDVLKAQKIPYEIICVDDGSSDQTLSVLRAFAEKVPELKIVTHGKRLGQGEAFWSGFRTARGDVIITMDGDGQNDFRDVPGMVALLDRYDGVFGQRVRRKDPIQKLIATRIGFFFRRIVLGDPVRDTACALKVMKKDALRYLVPVHGFFRFIPFMFQQAGLPYAAVEVNHRPRDRGVTKYSLLRGYFWSAIMDLAFMWWYRKNNIFMRLDSGGAGENSVTKNFS